MRTKNWGVTLLTACLVASLAACGGGSSEAEGEGGDDPKALRGEPVKVNMYYPETGSIAFPRIGVALEAAEKAVNDSGGINGRPFEIHTCDAQSPTDPNPTTACFREVLADQEIVAEIGDYGSFNDIVTPLQEKAGLPQIAGIPLGVSQMTLPNSFPLIAAEEQAMGAALVDHGSEEPALVYIDLPTAQKAFDKINEFLAAGRPEASELVAKQPAPLTATDLSPQVAALCEADGVALSLSYVQVAQFLTAHKQGPCPDQLVVAPALSIGDSLPQIAEQAEGMVVVSALPFISDDSFEGIKMFKEQMNAIDPEATQDITALHAWMAAWAFALEARKMDGEITRESVQEHWDNAGNVQVFDLLPPDLDLQDGLEEFEGSQRLTNHWVRYGKVENGEYVDTGDGWVDILDEG